MKVLDAIITGYCLTCETPADHSSSVLPYYELCAEMGQSPNRREQ